MSVVAKRVKEFLDQHFVCYETIPHITDFTASETAEHTHTPGRAFAKAVMVSLDGTPAMVVLPSHHVLDLADLRRALLARDIKLCGEKQIRSLFPDCDLGAIPPFGNLYGMEVYLSPSLRRCKKITFNAGSHEMVIRMSYVDYRELVRGLEINISHRPLQAG